MSFHFACATCAGAWTMGRDNRSADARKDPSCGGRANRTDLTCFWWGQTTRRSALDATSPDIQGLRCIKQEGLEAVTPRRSGSGECQAPAAVAPGPNLPFAGRLIVAARRHRTGSSRIAQHFHRLDHRFANKNVLATLNKRRGICPNLEASGLCRYQNSVGST